MPSPNRPTGPYQVVPDSDYLNRSIMKVVGPGAVCESIESAIEARRLADIANIAHAAGKRAVEGDAILALKQARNELVLREIALDTINAIEAALASAGQEVKT